MATAALIVSFVALVLSGLSVHYTRVQTQASVSADLRARRPVLQVSLEKAASPGEKDALFRIENVGSEDLDSVLLLGPIRIDGVDYPVARLGEDWQDEPELGPLPIRARSDFVLCVGSREDPPEFVARLRCRVAGDVWEVAYVLPFPRFNIQVF